MNEKLRVGWIGVGLMGHGCAKNILHGGYALTILGHRNRRPVDDLAGRGAHEAADMAELAARSDVVFTCLPSTRQVEQVVLGDGGLADHLEAGKILADCTTAEPDSTVRVGAALAARGVAMADCPFTRTPNEAEAGTLNLLVGADADALQRLRPILDCFSERIFHIGPLGMGHKMKLLNNVLGMTIGAANAEVIATAAKMGMDMRMFYDVITTGGGDNRMFRATMPWVLDGDDSQHRGTLWVGAKDMRAALKMADAVNAPTRMASLAHTFYRQALAKGHGDRFIPILPQLTAEEFGAKVRNL